MDTLRKRIIRLAEQKPEWKPKLLPLLFPKEARWDSPFESPTAEKLMADLERLPGVTDVDIIDTWKDGYFHFNIALKTQGTIPLAERARRPHVDTYNIPNYRQVANAVKRVIRQSRIHVDGIEGPKKLYEYRDQHHPTTMPRASGYNHDRIRLRFYVQDQTRRR